MAGYHQPARDADRAAAAEARQATLDRLHAQLRDGILALNDPQAWQAWLKFSSQFHREHRGEPNAAAVADEAVEILRLHAFSPRRRIVLLSSSAAGGDATVAPAFASLGNDLLAALPMNRAAFGGDAWVPATYAEGQPWTRDPRGSRVQDYSPRIPHGKVTKWQSTHIRPCQGVIIG